jgi:hypothetical protein
MPNRYPPRLLAITASYSENASGSYDGYEIDASGGAVTLTLQSPANRGRRTISNTGASGNATIATAGTSATINGGSSVTLYPGDSMTVVANGLTGSSAAWRVTGGNFGDAAGVTPGTATASKALVLNSSKGISTITSATITTLTASSIIRTSQTFQLGRGGTAKAGTTAGWTVNAGNNLGTIATVAQSQTARYPRGSYSQSPRGRHDHRAFPCTPRSTLRETR